MRILHFILGKANPDRANGVNQVVYGLAKYQSLAGHEVYVIGLSKSMTIKSEIIDRQYFKVEAYKYFRQGALKRIKELVANVDIVHLHGVWNFNNVKLGRYFESIGKPYIITAHCGYAIDRLKQSNYYLKLLYHYLWQKRLYEKAAGIHALTREESTDIHHFCDNSNIFVVSNGVDNDAIAPAYYYKLHHDRTVYKLGYLGRLSVEKNIDNLIKAIYLLPEKYRKKVNLILIGPIDEKAIKFQKLVRKLEINDSVTFVGPKYKEEKVHTLLDLDVYIHPALSDVVGIAVMEAFSMGLPSIVTRTSHMSYFYKTNSFIMSEPTAEDLSRSIVEMIDRKDEWTSLSQNAINLVEDTFNWRVAVAKLIKEYEKAVAKVSVPKN